MGIEEPVDHDAYTFQRDSLVRNSEGLPPEILPMRNLGSKSRKEHKAFEKRESHRDTPDANPDWDHPLDFDKSGCHYYNPLPEVKHELATGCRPG